MMNGITGGSPTRKRRLSPDTPESTTTQASRTEANGVQPLAQTRVPKLAGPKALEDGYVRASKSPGSPGSTGSTDSTDSTATLTRGLREKAAELVSPHTLRLTSSAGEVREVPGASYFVDGAGRPRPQAAGVMNVLARRSAATQQRIDAKLTAAHGEFEMSFRVKGESGHYDKIHDVPVSGVVVPYRQEHFEMLVRSTGPVLRALREMLQVVYSKPTFDAKDLGLAHVPADEAEHVLSAIRSSVYFEPKLVDPVMAEYPFLTVAGFDASPGDVDRPEPVFFEYNLGTPSGLSNNIQLLDVLKKEDPAMFAAVGDRLPTDETFAILRRAVESNALAWTRNPAGISVVIGPGRWNGAHPDVASIALFSGMPLVEPQDLYQDADGWIRLNTGEGEEHPVVTGIYGRAEESYFFQSNEDGIPIRGPDIDNRELSARFGVELEPAVQYALKYDDDDEVVGIRRDADGKPVYQEVFGGGLGVDPARPEADRGSFARAVKSRRLYYSGLGGRTVDDKRIFQVVSEYVAPSHLRGEEAIARPPRTLKVADYAEFYESSELERFVVKVPDQSGGSGVLLLANLSPAARRDAVELVKKDPGLYIVQEFATPALALTAEQRGDEVVLGSTANDLRIFSIMDAEGNVDAGPNSVLLRMAQPRSASTNTSQGAGYGIAAVVASKATRNPKAPILPEVAGRQRPGLARLADLESYLFELNWLTDLTASPATEAESRQGRPGVMADQQRAVMDLLGREFSPLMALARKYERGEVSRKDFHDALLAHRERLYEQKSFPADIADVVHRKLAGYRPALDDERGRPISAEQRAQLRARLDVELFDTPKLVRRDFCGDEGIEKFAVGRYRVGPHPMVESVRAKLEALGGALHAIRMKDPSGGWSEDIAGAYFQVDDDGVPSIGIDLTQDFALAAVAHEAQHLGHWDGERRKLIASGMSDKEARVQAMLNVNTPEERARSEERSVMAELDAEAKYSGDWNQGRARARQPTEHGWACRLGYPSSEAVFDLLHREALGEPIDRGTVRTHLDKLIDLALMERKQKFRSAMLVAERAPPAEAKRLKAVAYADLQEPLFDLAFGVGGYARATSLGVCAPLHGLFAEALQAREGRIELLLPVDRRRYQAQIQ